MASLQPAFAWTPETQQERTTLVLFPQKAPFDSSHLAFLATDFFRWLEEIWQFPVVQPQAPTWQDLDHLLSPLQIAAEEWYTIQDLCLSWGYTVNKVWMDLTKYEVHSERRLDRHGTLAGNPPKVYHGRQLAPVIAHWEWQRLHVALDACWGRFAQPRCGPREHTILTTYAAWDKEQVRELVQQYLTRTEAQKETAYYQQEAGLAKLGDRRLQQENIQLRKQVLDLQRRVKALEEQLANGTCGNN